MKCPLDDEIEILPVDLPLDRRTAAWLEELAEETGAEPEVLIASILHDVRTDDDEIERIPRQRYFH
jgi:hypothetical protein